MRNSSRKLIPLLLVCQFGAATRTVKVNVPVEQTAVGVTISNIGGIPQNVKITYQGSGGENMIVPSNYPGQQWSNFVCSGNTCTTTSDYPLTPSSNFVTIIGHTQQVSYSSSIIITISVLENKGAVIAQAFLQANGSYPFPIPINGGRPF